MSSQQPADVDSRIDSIVERLDEIEEELEHEREEKQRLQEENRELRGRNEELNEKVDALEKETDILESRCDALAKGLDELEQRLEDGDLADDVERGADPEVPREVPLEDIVALPDPVAERELDPNVERARWVAGEASTAGDKTPAGYRLTAGQIGRFLDVALDVDPHPQTVARVLSILDELGKDQTHRRKKNGEKRIAFDEDLATRLEAHAEMRPDPG